MTYSLQAEDEALSVGIRSLREHLLSSGFQHGARPGELVSMADNGVEIHIRTGYTMGSFRLTVFGRLKGSRQGMHYLDFNRGVDPGRFRDIQLALADWDGETWPPHPDMVPAVTGHGDGWPPVLDE